MNGYGTSTTTSVYDYVNEYHDAIERQVPLRTDKYHDDPNDYRRVYHYRRPETRISPSTTTRNVNVYRCRRPVNTNFLYELRNGYFLSERERLLPLRPCTTTSTTTATSTTIANRPVNVCSEGITPS